MTELETEFHDREQQCRAVALQLGELDPAILAVALVGSCARGALSPGDIDFLILVDGAEKIIGLEERIRGSFSDSDTRYSFIFYTLDNLNSLVTRRSPNTYVVQFARFLTRLLRHMRALKKFLIWLLGHRKTYLQMREVLPQSFQTAIPLYDPDHILTDFQASQVVKLRSVLQPWEREFYSPYGFHKLLEGYLSGQVDLATVHSILSDCDIDSEDYVERLAVYYDQSHEDERARRCRAIFNSNVSQISDTTESIIQ